MGCCCRYRNTTRLKVKGAATVEVSGIAVVEVEPPESISKSVRAPAHDRSIIRCNPNSEDNPYASYAWLTGERLICVGMEGVCWMALFA